MLIVPIIVLVWLVPSTGDCTSMLQAIVTVSCAIATAILAGVVTAVMFNAWLRDSVDANSV